MEQIIKWRFPGNRGTKRNGLDTADLHTFMDDPEASLAREICQNSNDALRKKAIGPAVVEFHLFDMKISTIPQHQSLIDELERCKEYWENDTNDIKDRVQEMIDTLKAERIKCLRISDFNTTGLNGVLDYEDEDSVWYSLLHGSGASSKNEQEGGSKGVGKYATFVNSSIRTVFYSTYTEQNNQRGYQGISYFCSSKIKDSPTGELTQGIGFYGINSRNDAVDGELYLDPDFEPRHGNNYGTDIYIIGFNGGEKWKQNILAKILDSFMVAIAKGRLEVRIDDIFVNKNTFKDLAKQFINLSTPLARSVVSQSLLLSDDENVQHKKIDIEYSGDLVSTVDLYYRRFSGDEQKLATNSCSMIRYPYMKIQDYKNVVSSQMGVSALCVLPEGNLSSLFKQSENPEHTKWKWERIIDSERREVADQLYTQLKTKIHDIIVESLKSPNTSETDAEGAGEYLPEKSDEEKDKPTDKPAKILKSPKISKPKKNKSSEIKTYEEDPEGNGVGLDIGENSEIPFEEFLSSAGDNHAKDGNFDGDEQENGKKDFDGSEKFVRNKMTGTKYRFFCRDKSEGLYSLNFRAPETAEEAELELSIVDGAGSKEGLNIIQAFKNNEQIKIRKHKIVTFSFVEGEVVNLLVRISRNELVSVEVSLYAIR